MDFFIKIEYAIRRWWFWDVTMNYYHLIEFITGKRECYECAGTGRSARGYGDSSSCGSCNERGWTRMSWRRLIHNRKVKRESHKTRYIRGAS